MSILELKVFVKKAWRYIADPRKIVQNIKDRILHSSYGKELDDAEYLKRQFKLNLGYALDIENPRTFNEKMQWLKLYDRNPEYTAMVDKYLSKALVAEKIGEKYIAKLLGVWESVDEIELDRLPEQFVLKTTHDCGGVVVCKDKSTLNWDKAKKFLRKHMKREYFYNCREWPYKNIQPRIIAEAFLQDKNNAVLPVYKILCFGGEPKIIQTVQNDKKPNESIDYFDTDWRLMPFRQNYPNSKTLLPRPERLDEMLAIARELAADTSFIRIDLYSVNGEIYFSEFTFFSDAGFAPFYPKQWDDTLGSWIDLPTKS